MKLQGKYICVKDIEKIYSCIDFAPLFGTHKCNTEKDKDPGNVSSSQWQLNLLLG